MLETTNILIYIQLKKWKAIKKKGRKKKGRGESYRVTEKKFGQIAYAKLEV